MSMDIYHALALIAQFNVACNEKTIITLLRELTEQMGFDHFRLYLISPKTIQRPNVRILNGCPIAWVNKYTRQGLLAIDPVVRRGIIQTMPILWESVIRECCDHQDEVGLDIMLQAQDAGLSDGVTLPWHGANGHIGLLSLMTQQSRREGQWLTDAPLLLWLSTYIFEAIARICLVTECTQPALSLRELEVCQWSAEGKQVSDIATILGITSRTVTYHLNSVKEKLGASSKNQAISWGIKQGLVRLNVECAQVCNVNENTL